MRNIKVCVKNAFTLAEVLIVLAIIGVIASITVPSVIAFTQQQEFSSGLAKAVSRLNQAISLNIAINSESPYDNANLFRYLVQSMSVMQTTTSLRYSTGDNFAFYTTDGMRFEIPYDKDKFLDLYETKDVLAYANNGKCGSYGLDKNPDGTKYPPCIIIVDVNGDRKPNPQDVNEEGVAYSFAGPEELLIKDVFTILVSESTVRPYGVVAQRTMYKANRAK